MAEEEKWSLIITPKRKLLDLQIRELIRYRDLIFLFVKRDFITKFKQTILGPLWFVIQPIVSTIMFTFVFGNLAGIGTDEIPHTLFFFSGTMLWTFFTSNFSSSSTIFITSAGIFGKVYFPRLAVPISNVFTNLIKVSIQFALFVGIFVFYIVRGAPVHPSWTLLLFPLLFMWLAAIGVGMGIIISALTTKYRDLQHLVSFMLHLAMYATPVVFPLSEIPQRFMWIAFLNPVSAPIELFRLWFFGAASVNGYMILSSMGITVLLVFVGLIMFNRNEQTFIDVV
ncbi:MAG: ABC transporter permease [Treponema sp.]|nr:ABC transporter permease [Treponema sp.]